jgi:hypothetical protein
MKNKKLILWILLGAIVYFSNCTDNHEAIFSLHRKIDYPRSKLIKKFTWIGEPVRYPQTNSDMHWYSWGIDDAIYVVDDDGQNFGGKANYAHLLKITGNPPHHRVETVTDFENYNFRSMIPKRLVRRYVNGMLAVDALLYICIYDYDWDISEKIYDFDDVHQRIKKYFYGENLSSEYFEKLSFIDSYSKNGGIAGIIMSRDFGKTWENIPNENTPQFLGEKFAGMSFITWGAGYSNVPKELGNYVYGISNDGNWESGDNVFMARVHRDSILVRSAWCFYAGTNEGKVLWTSIENDAKPIFSDKGHVGHPTMSYNRALDRYILMIYSDTIPHRIDAPIEEWRKWDYASELQLYESPTPFGPWSIFYNEIPWGGKEHSCYLGQMPAKWLSQDGLSGYVMFAGDYANRKGEYYGLMLQQFKIEKY